MLDDLPFTLPSLRSAYADGVSPVAVIEEVYRRIAEVDDPGIFIDLFDRTEVLATVDALAGMDRSLPLWGIPFAIKDNIDVAGHETTAACPAYSYRAKQDAVSVARLRAARNGGGVEAWIGFEPGTGARTVTVSVFRPGIGMGGECLGAEETPGRGDVVFVPWHADIPDRRA